MKKKVIYTGFEIRSPQANGKIPNWLKKLLKWLCYVLLLLLSLFLLGGIFKRCDNKPGSGNKGTGDPDANNSSQLLPLPITSPGNGGYLPIDPGDIGYGRDSIGQIVLDRINVLLEKKTPETAGEFAQAFKRLYPDNGYDICYFDTLTYRLQLKVPPEKQVEISDNLNSQMPEFEFLVFDESVFFASYQPADPAFSDGDKCWYFGAVNVYAAWDITMGDPQVKVAIVDNGFDLSHPEFKDCVVLPFNMIERNSHLYPPSGSDCPGHGTHVAATAIGRMNNGAGACGIAPKCLLMPVQVADEQGMMSLTSILDGVLYAIYKGANVVNLSLGSIVNPMVKMMPPPLQIDQIRHYRNNEERVWQEVFKIAEHRNCTVVMAAGNESYVSGWDAMKRDQCSIVVSAFDRQSNQASFSNYGDYPNIYENFSTISAPGVDIYNAFPNNQYASIQGTSMASPIVAGAVALMKSLNPKLTTFEIASILRKTGRPTQFPIGPLLDIEAALQCVKNGDYKDSEVPKQDDSERKLGRGDLNDPKKMNGVWRASEQLSNKVSGEKITLYMKIDGKQSELIIVENKTGETYRAPITVNVVNNKMSIRQTDVARSSKGDYYNRYSYSCTADTDGTIRCVAKLEGSNDVVDFYLVKV